MKRIFCLLSVFAMIFSFAACSGKKHDGKNADVTGEKTFSKKISAEEGGKIENSDGTVSIEIPGGALDADTTITMTISDPSAFPSKEGEKVISSIVEFEPSGLIFRKPVIITMTSLEKVENKIITAAVYHENEKEWSYSEDAAVKFSGYTETGDPIMTTATGDPIMLNATGDPIMQSATGDPIMLAATGDPIMMTATGDPIMMTATGDPIMMTTGHFTAFTFIAVPEGSAEENDDENGDTDTSDIEISDEDSDTSEEEQDETEDDGDTDTDTGEPEPDPVYSKVLCTGSSRCTDGSYAYTDCPENGEALYGQDAQYAGRKSCISHKYTKETVNNQQFVVDNVTGLKWHRESTGNWMTYENAKDYCETLVYGGIEEWRFPTPKEILSITDSDNYNSALREFYFHISGDFWVEENNGTPYVWNFDSMQGSLNEAYMDGTSRTVCVSGSVFGEVSAENYITQAAGNGEETVFDKSTNLLWRNAPASAEKWKEALAYCEGLEYAGYSDWRLPNKNELVTLVDYSKAETGLLSSFPGITTGSYFISSTPVAGYGEAAGVWVVNMSNGIVTSSKYPDIHTYSVLCVRSDTENYPDGMNMPYCDETGVAPCRDKVSSIVWSPIVSTYDQPGLAPWYVVATECRRMANGNSRKWRMPSIDEARTLATNCGDLGAGGGCNISEDCRDFSAECYQASLCQFSGGCESGLNDFGVMITSTDFNGGDIDGAWAVNYETASLSVVDNPYSIADYSVVIRCVLDESIQNRKNFPYTDANGLVWSKPHISVDGMKWEEAAKYCLELNEGGSNNWRVPTIDELRTLVQDCGTTKKGGTCGVTAENPDSAISGDNCRCTHDVKGGHSIFAEAETLWSSTVSSDTYNPFLALDFLYASIERKDKEKMLNLYCVRNPETEPAERPQLEYPYRYNNLWWSDKSPEEYTYTTAADYCNYLNSSEYPNVGYGNWSVPTIAQLKGLLKGCESQSSCTVPSGADNGTSYCECTPDFSGHSVLGDTDYLLSSTKQGNNYFQFIDFMTGAIKVDRQNYGQQGYVRCVRSALGF